MVLALSVAAVILFVSITYYLRGLKPSVVRVQLSFSERRFRRLLSQWSENDLRRFQKHFAGDYLFILTYACLGYASGIRPLEFNLACPAVSFALVGAAGFDLVENVLHQRFLLASNGSLKSYLFKVAGVSATAKFVLWGTFIGAVAAKVVL